MKYLEWNDIIAKNFFNEEKAGKEVLLYVNEDIINGLGKRAGCGIDDFVTSLKNGPPGTTRSGFCQKSLQVMESWRQRDYEYPPYVAYLAFFVLAAGVDGDFDPKAYYPRFWTLLKEQDSGTPPSFGKMILLWDDLEKWSREDKHEELGRFVARIRGNWWKVGLPLSQTVISEEEKSRLPLFFESADLDPASPPTSEIIAKLMKYYGGGIFERRTLKLLNIKGDDTAIKDKLLDVVLEELELWDGKVESKTKEEQGRSSYSLQTGLRICLSLDFIAKKLSGFLRLKTNRPYPEDGLIFESTHYPGKFLSCDEAFQGWSKPVKIEEIQKLDALEIDWKNGIQFSDKENNWRARLKGEDVRLFVSGKNEGLPGWIETQKLERGIEFLTTVSKDITERVRQWGQSNCDSFTELDFTGLPAGWTLFKGKNASCSCEEITVLTLSSSVRLLLRGGIKIRGGNTYLYTAPPAVVLENVSGEEIVKINGSPMLRKDRDSHIWEIPGDTPVNEILKIEVKVGEEEFKRILRLEEPNMPDSFEGVPWRDMKGNICSESSDDILLCGTTMKIPGDKKQSSIMENNSFSTNRVYLLGEQPGQIADLSEEKKPECWIPVWAVKRISRKEYSVKYCLNSLKNDESPEDIDSEIDRKKIKKWKEVVWVNRKITKKPRIPLVRKRWEKLAEAAKNV